MSIYEDGQQNRVSVKKYCGQSRLERVVAIQTFITNHWMRIEKDAYQETVTKNGRGGGKRAEFDFGRASLLKPYAGGRPLPTHKKVFDIGDSVRHNLDGASIAPLHPR